MTPEEEESEIDYDNKFFNQFNFVMECNLGYCFAASTGLGCTKSHNDAAANEAIRLWKEVGDGVRGNRSVDSVMTKDDFKLLLAACFRRCLTILGETP